MLHHRTLFHIVDWDTQHGTWTLTDVILRAKKRMDHENQMYSYQSFGNWCFRFILSQSFQASQSYSPILRYRLLSFKFLVILFYKKPALAIHTHNESHLEIVAQILRKKGRKSLN